VLCDTGGKLLSHVRGPGCSPDSLGVAGSVAVLTALVEDARRAADCRVPVPMGSAAFLLAGVDQQERESEMVAALAPYGLADDVMVSNDTFAVLLAGSPSGSGVAVVCGAGLNALGVTPDGVVGRYQALGELSGDWGGGQAVGLAALGAAIRGQDGRGPATLLTDAVCRHFVVDEPQAVAAAIHEQRLDAQALVDLAPVVFAAANAADAVATGLVERLGDEVAGMAVALMRRLGLDTQRTCVVLGGGMLQADHAALIERISTAVVASAPDAEIRVLDVPPVVGAVRAALRRVASSSGDIDRAIDRLVKELAGSPRPSEELMP